MKFLIVDASNLIHRIKHVVTKPAKTRFDPFGEDQDDPVELKIGMIISGFFNSLLIAHQRFNADHLVIAFDSYSWRKDAMIGYKTRPEPVTPAEIEDKAMMAVVIEELHNYFQNYTNATVLKAIPLEADDLIARWTQLHDGSDFQHVILSSDSDFKQLVREGVDLYHPLINTLFRSDGIYFQDGKNPSDADIIVSLHGQDWKVKVDENGSAECFDPGWELFQKCIRGDINDTIPSAWPRVRTEKMKRAYYGGPLEYNNFINSTWGKDDDKRSVRDLYERNKGLIDLAAQPDWVVEVMDTTIVEAVEKSHRRMIGVFFLKFCGKFGLNRLMERETTYTSMLRGTYQGA